jgi:transcriptional regulator with GAF, ATPase, and Fis domain
MHASRTPGAETAKVDLDLELERQHRLERHFWRLWFLLVGVSLVSLLGLATTIPTLRGRLPTFWPWEGTDVVLLTGLLAVNAFFATYATFQQKKLAAVRERLAVAQEEAKERARRHYSRLMALFSVSQIMGTENDPRKVFDCITDMCQQIFNSQQASLMLVNDKSGDLEVQSAIGHLNPEEVLGARQKVGHGISGWVAEQRKPALINSDTDMRKYPGLDYKPRALASAMVVPLVVRDELAGVLSVSNRSSDVRYTDEDLSALLVFAENAETVIRHAEQTDWMRQTIQSLRDRVMRHEPTAAV